MTATTVYGIATYAAAIPTYNVAKRAGVNPKTAKPTPRINSVMATVASAR